MKIEQIAITKVKRKIGIGRDKPIKIIEKGHGEATKAILIKEEKKRLYCFKGH